MIRYRPTRKYKYQLIADYTVLIELTGRVVRTEYMDLGRHGTLLIRTGYAWDGPSGISIDTPSFMRGSLVHDALYQLMREEHLPQSCREYADNLLRDICIEDGMWKARAWWVYQAVRKFGAKHARPDLHTAP